MEKNLKILGIHGSIYHICRKTSLMGSLKYDTSSGLVRCLYCGEPIKQAGGRPDRKFCSTSCKNNYHNANRHLESRRYHDRITRILESNYYILNRLVKLGVSSIDRYTLNELEFNFQFSTSYCKLGHRQHYACFEIEYDLTPTRVINIMNFMDKVQGE